MNASKAIPLAYLPDEAETSFSGKIQARPSLEELNTRNQRKDDFTFSALFL